MAADVAALVARYADRFHRNVGDGHHVASPLGAWLVLALAAPAATGAARDELADALGCPVGAARDAAARLLGRPHPAVANAAAAWLRQECATPAIEQWRDALPPEVERGEMPDQTSADEWARRNTGGLIDSFPLRITRRVALVLASALATRVSWQVPFELAPASALGATPWGTSLRHVLRSPDSHTAFIARTETIGEVVVHAAASADGLVVTSVIADEGVAGADVLAAAYEIAAGRVRPRSLFDLPLGERPLWTIEEVPRAMPRERCTAVLPAWKARSDHQLSATPALGFDTAGSALTALLPPGDYRVTARQSAMARYSREGFEAAAVTAIGVMAAAMMSGGRARRATLRFAHPYAVVATVAGTGAWRGMPAFSAWVAEPTDAS